MNVCVLIPVYNDWLSLRELLRRLDAALRSRPDCFSILVIDDGSSSPEEDTLCLPLDFDSVRILRLRRNLGHQRAIAIGLTWLHENQKPDGIVVMDGDGEDKPEDVPRLLDLFAAARGSQSVFAARTRRSEGLFFTLFYKLFQFSHWVMAGLPVKIGNFSVLSPDHLDSLVVSSDLWNHYAASMVRLRVPLATLPTHRGHRYQGRSRMSFSALVRHGVRALAVYSDIIAVRFLIVASAACLFCIVLLGICIGIRLFTDWAVPGWATYVSALLLILLVQVISITFSVTVHAFSTSSAFLPIRDYVYFVRGLDTVQPVSNQLGISSAS